LRINQIEGQFSAYLIEMLEHPGFRVLSLAAHRVLFRICIEHAHHGGKENGRLPITYDNFVVRGGPEGQLVDSKLNERPDH
jgi:hypothetical protein